jgi:ferritin-like protein
VIAGRVSKNKKGVDKIGIDLRDVVLKPLTDEYVNAYYYNYEAYCEHDYAPSEIEIKNITKS